MKATYLKNLKYNKMAVKLVIKNHMFRTNKDVIEMETLTDFVLAVIVSAVLVESVLLSDSTFSVSFAVNLVVSPSENPAALKQHNTGKMT